MRFCYFDLEMSGKSKNKIIQIGATGSCIKDANFDVYIYPKGSISEYCTEHVHGIKKAHRTLYKDGEKLDNVVDLKQGLEDFMVFLDDNFIRTSGQGAILVAHSAFESDAPILIENLQKFYDDDIIEEYIFGFCDTLEAVEKYLPGKRSLAKLKKYFRIDGEVEHDALQDSIDLWQVVQNLRQTRSCQPKDFTWYDNFLMGSFRPVSSFL